MFGRTNIRPVKNGLYTCTTLQTPVSNLPLKTLHAQQTNLQDVAQQLGPQQHKQKWKKSTLTLAIIESVVKTRYALTNKMLPHRLH